MIRHLAPAAILAAALLWAPWPFGSVLPWAAAVVAVAGPVALAAGSLTGARLRSARTVALPVAALLALAALGVLQSLPWPAGVAAALSPEHVRLAQEATAALVLEGEPPAAPADGGPVALSLAPGTSRRTAFLLAGLAAALAAGAVAGRDRFGRRLLGGAVLAVAVAQVLYGAPRWLARSRQMWGVEVPGGERLRGTFVNPNHFALLLEIALPIAFAWGWWSVARARRELSAERRLALVAPPALVWLGLFVALAFSGSRAGMLAAVAGLGVQALALAATAPAVQGRRSAGRSSRRLLRVGLRAGAAAAVLAAGVAAVLLTGGSAGFARFSGGSGTDVAAAFRIEVYRSTLSLWRQFPWTGTGLGSFLEAFPLVQPEGPDLVWWHAHSDPLELLATGGLLGAVVGGLGAGALGIALVGRLRRVRRTEERVAVAAGIGAFVAVGLHELVDFGLTMPANALALAVVVGAAAAVRQPLRRSAHGVAGSGPGSSRSTGPGQTRAPSRAASVRSSIR